MAKVPRTENPKQYIIVENRAAEHARHPVIDLSPPAVLAESFVRGSGGEFAPSTMQDQPVSGVRTSTRLAPCQAVRRTGGSGGRGHIGSQRTTDSGDACRRRDVGRQTRRTSHKRQGHREARRHWLRAQHRPPVCATPTTNTRGLRLRRKDGGARGPTLFLDAAHGGSIRRMRLAELARATAVIGRMCSAAAHVTTGWDTAHPRRGRPSP